MKAKISVLGHFGKNLNLSNGQTIKTKIITEELIRQFTEAQVIKIDTHGGIKTLFKAPFQVITALKNSKNVIILPAHNGLRVFGRLLPFFKKLFTGRKIHYVVIGGWLPEFLQVKKSLAKALKRFDYIYVETDTMKRALDDMGFSNAIVMPNCKKLDILCEDELLYPQGMPYKLCTFSRVTKEKGIEDAVNAVKTINESCGETVYTLDIYGQVDEGQTQWFEKLKSDFPQYVNYGGIVPFDKSVDVLKNYFALLFPTYYKGEGFAGTLLDAFAAGLPVIASDWRYNTEVVTENTGYLYPTGSQADFVEILRAVAKDSSMIINKKINCIKEAEKYSTDKALQVLTEKIEGR